jgi:uncharacterized protein (TIGR02001 family)
LPPRSALARCALWACSLLAGGAAHAQFGVSVGVESDNRFRGVSLSDGQPDLRLSLSYDHDSGAFAGATATRVEFMRGRHSTQLLGYAGYVTRVTPGLGVEAGVTSSTFSGNARYDYTEIFAGVLSERWSLRAYYAPDYFGFGQATAYVEVDANAPLTPRLRLFGHVGALSALGGLAADAPSRTRTDLRVGLGFGALPSVDVQLAWVTATRGGPYVVEYSTRRNTFVLSALASF